MPCAVVVLPVHSCRPELVVDAVISSTLSHVRC